MSRDLLERMRRNPAGDWTMADVKMVCSRHGIACKPPPGGGSHFKLEHGSVPDILTVPARRPIRPVYIRSLVRFVDLVLRSEQEK